MSDPVLPSFSHYEPDASDLTEGVFEPTGDGLPEDIDEVPWDDATTGRLQRTSDNFLPEPRQSADTT